MPATLRHDEREPGAGDDGDADADADTDAGDRAWAEAPSGDVLGLLGDEYACRILSALDAGPRPAAELVERCDASRSTVYRRLDRLEALGLVATSMQCEPDGHHRKEFRLVLDEVRLRVGGDGVDGRIAVADRATE